jgi:hypothetical protein
MANTTSQKIFELKLGDVEAFKQLGSQEAALVETVIITAPVSTYRSHIDVTRQSHLSEEFSSQFSLGTNIKRVEFNAISEIDNGRDAIRLITEFPFWLKGFTKVQHLVVEIACRINIFNEDQEKDLVKSLMKNIEEKVGVRSRCVARTDKKDKKFLGYITHWDRLEGEEEIIEPEYYAAEKAPRDVYCQVEDCEWTARDGQFM